MTPALPPSLPAFPSCANLVNGSNDDLVEALLRIIEQHGLHIPPKKIHGVVRHLWNVGGMGILDGRFKPWAAGRVTRNMTERIKTIFDRYALYTSDEVRYPNALQVLAKRIYDEQTEAHAERNQRAATERRQVETQQATNDLIEVGLGLLPPRRLARTSS